MDKTKRFLDPVIVVREERAAGEGDASTYRYWVPNGYHRLTALKELGARTVLGLLVPKTAVAYQILALNIKDNRRTWVVARAVGGALGAGDGSRVLVAQAPSGDEEHADGAGRSTTAAPGYQLLTIRPEGQAPG
jgi:hypothetical protein